MAGKNLPPECSRSRETSVFSACPKSHLFVSRLGDSINKLVPFRIADRMGQDAIGDLNLAVALVPQFVGIVV
jgi:hypothetical protein